MAAYETDVETHKAKLADIDDESGDENTERGNWSSKLDFLLSCLGYAVGLGNVWRFPYLCYRNGGGAFFIPYCIALAFLGIPIFLLELAIGQYSSAGPFTCWKYSPIFTGIGYGMFIVSALVAIYYNMIIAWAFFYLFASFTDELPWQSCGDWSTNLCYDNVKILNKTWESCNGNNRWGKVWEANVTQGICYETGMLNKKEGVRAYLDADKAKDYFPRTLPSQEYFDNYVTGSGYSSGYHDLGGVRWQLALCYLLAFICVILALSKSIKTSGKVVYFTATFPYIVLVILFFRGLMLEGMEEGIKFYITPDLKRLSDAQVWKDAAVQIFFSLSASWGGLIALASYNKFHNDLLRDTLIVTFGNCLTSVFAGFVIFSYLGYLSTYMGLPVDEVAKSGPSLTFVVYPFAVTKMPISPLWAILFFVMLITLGVDSEFVLVETVITSLMDRFPKLRKYKLFTVMTCCLLFFLLGLTLTTDGGIYMLSIMDTYSGGWSILFIAIFECISVGWVYGIFRFLDDIKLMTGNTFCCCVPFIAFKYWWMLCWCFITPLLAAIIMVFSWVDYTGMDNGAEYDVYADLMGWGMTLVTIVCIVGTAIYVICKTGGIKEAMKPNIEWGPALVRHRREAEYHTKRYASDFIVDPWGLETASPNDVHLQSNKKGVDNEGFSNIRV
ncbi:sodium-dependent proline transporter isoform X2 [Magallana gigas]|uniref:sodium-dependent proline transporter isoform X2 n=1 Tax=Magallana gigas TaxID=29159 RepID=UPI00333FEB55